MILLYLQKKEIYDNFTRLDGNIDGNLYFLTNKTWLENYKKEFNFYDVKFKDVYKNYFYAKNDKRIKRQ